MPTAIDQLPDDVEQLKQLVINLGARLVEQAQQIAEKQEQIVEKQAELAVERNEVIAARLLIEKLKLQIARYRRQQYGRKSERHDAHVAQLELIVEELESSLAAAGGRQPADAVPAEAATSARSKPARRPLPDHLPRETQEHAAACACPECGGALKRIGEDVAEQLEFVPEHFKVIRHVRPKFACGKCQRIVQAAAPSRPIDKGVAGPGLLAHVAVSKYVDHLPLYRQSEIYARQGVDLERSTLAGWIAGVAELVSPLAEAIGRYVTAATKVHADDTTVPVLDPGRGKTKTGRLWVYVRDDRPAGSKEPPAAL
jgi:transposase